MKKAKHTSEKALTEGNKYQRATVSRFKPDAGKVSSSKFTPAQNWINHLFDRLTALDSTKLCLMLLFILLLVALYFLGTRK